MTTTEFWQNTLLSVLSSINQWQLYLLPVHARKWEGGMHIVKQMSFTTVPTLLCEVSLDFYLCITASGPPVTGFSHHSRWFNASDVNLFFITHPTSFSHFTVGSSSSSSSQWPGHYLLWPSVILHVYHMPIPLQHTVFHSLQNCSFVTLFFL
jgi:hypothetical protein